MVKLIQKNNFWYLQYSYKENGETITLEKYLGKEVPKNILIIKEEFAEEVFRVRYGVVFDKIISNFNLDFKKYNEVAKKKYFSQFAIKFTYNSQAIEGSTLSLKDTLFLIEQGISPVKKFEDIQNSKTHYDVFIEIMKLNKDLSYDLVLEFHKKLFEKTYGEIAGKIRNHPVRVLGSKSIFSHQTKVEEDLKEFFNWYDKNKTRIHPIRLASLVHLKFVSIHPFSDGNGRISRLIMNYVLNLHKYPLIDIDYIKRKSYYNALEKDQVNGFENYFVDFIAKKFIKDYSDFK